MIVFLVDQAFNQLNFNLLITDGEGEFPWFANPLLSFVDELKGTGGESEGDGLGLAGLEGDFVKALE